MIGLNSPLNGQVFGQGKVRKNQNMAQKPLFRVEPLRERRMGPPRFELELLPPQGRRMPSYPTGP